MLYFVEYFNEGSGEPVNLSIGLRSMDAARHRGKTVARLNGNCGFWISRKKPEAGVMPERIEYHSCSWSPRGEIMWRPVILRESRSVGVEV